MSNGEVPDPIGSGGATIDDVNSTLQNIARQLANQAQIQSNASPVATASFSPLAYSYNNISTSATTVIRASVRRFGLVFHNPGGTSAIFVYPQNVTGGTPTATALGGTFQILPGGTLSFPSPLFANVNGTWLAFAGTGTGQAFTVVEFG